MAIEHLKPHQFKKGDPNRPQPTDNGAGNYRRLQRMFAQILEDPDYWRSFKAAAIARKLPPAVEAAMLHYYAGKPKDVVDVTHRVESDAVIGLPPAQLAQRHEAITLRLQEIQNALAAKNAEAERDKLGVAWAEDANMPKRPM